MDVTKSFIADEATHYWHLVLLKLDYLDSVQYVNQSQKNLEVEDKAKCWLGLVINGHDFNLETLFQFVFQSKNWMDFYDVDQSYMFQNRDELLRLGQKASLFCQIGRLDQAFDLYMQQEKTRKEREKKSQLMQQQVQQSVIEFCDVQKEQQVEQNQIEQFEENPVASNFEQIPVIEEQISKIEDVKVIKEPQFDQNEVSLESEKEFQEEEVSVSENHARLNLFEEISVVQEQSSLLENEFLQLEKSQDSFYVLNQSQYKQNQTSLAVVSSNITSVVEMPKLDFTHNTDQEVVYQAVRLNSQVVLETEFSQIIKRIKPVSSFVIDQRLCHECQRPLPNSNIFQTLINSTSMLFLDSANVQCNLCRERVCSVKCLAPKKICIPQQFHLLYKCEPQTVCRSAYRELKVHQNLIYIDKTHAQVRLHPEFERFFKKRQDLNALFDSIKCSVWHNIVEKNSLSEVKNLLLPKCYLYLDQLQELQNGSLERKLDFLMDVIIAHFTIDSENKSINKQSCGSCILTAITCDVCLGKHGGPFFQHQISAGGKCKSCDIFAHIQCLETRHFCSSDGRSLPADF